MATIVLTISKTDVYAEVEKATDYTGAKLIDGDENARDRITAGDSDLSNLSRFWNEAGYNVEERLKSMIYSSVNGDGTSNWKYTLEVSKSYDTNLNHSVESSLKSYFISYIIGKWFKFANKGEAEDYFVQAFEFLTSAERLLYSRKKPSLPKS